MTNFQEYFVKHRLAPLAIALLVSLVWLGIGGIGGPIFGKIADVESNNQENFLPSNSESTKVQNVIKQFQNTDSIPAVVIVTAAGNFTPGDLRNLTNLKTELAAISGLSQEQPVIGPVLANNEQAAQFIVEIDASKPATEVVGNLRATLKRNLDSSLKSYVTGPAGLTADLTDAFGGIDGILLIVAFASVFVILLLVYRSFILPVAVLLLDMVALSGSILIIYFLAKNNLLSLNGQAQGILSILVIGASTDYSLLIISRYRESLHVFENKWQALISALKNAFEPVAASAVTVILALLCLLFSNLRSNQSLGPVAAIGIAFAFLAAMTFLPALLGIFGRLAFWPVLPRYEHGKVTTDMIKNHGFWYKVAQFVSVNPRKIWVAACIALFICAFGIAQFKARGVSIAGTIRTTSEAVTGESVLAKYFPAGAGNPLYIVAPAGARNLVLNIAKATPGLNDVSFYSEAAPSYVKPLPLIKRGKALITATLSENPSSQAAENIVKSLRTNLASTGSGALVGGQTAIMLDTNSTTKADLFRIIPIVLVVVFVVLAFLLRALIAPALLVLSVILSYTATLGISALLFNHVFNFSGADPSVPLFGFVFLVALGIDYNIFLMSRIREETKLMSTTEATIKGLTVTGGVITSAGIVLAATFAALAVIPILFLLELAFIVALGVLVDTTIVRSLIVPALVLDLNDVVWWPWGNRQN